jgi:5,10-methylenetetrahydromethanopterin reductase
VAGATERMLVGPCVTDPYTRHPALTAMAIATLDELSGGRAVLGVGAGISGFEQLQLERRQPAQAVRETVELVRALLTGEHVEYAGRVISFSGKLDFHAPRADIPVYIAAGGERMLAVAGAVADGVIIEGCMAERVLREAIDRIHAAARDTGRDPTSIDIVARIDVAVDASMERAYDTLRIRVARHLINDAPAFPRFAARGLDVPPALAERVASLGYTHDTAILDPIAAEIPDGWIDAFCIAATPESVGERISWLAERGVTQLLVNPVAPNDAVESVIEAVGGSVTHR